VVGLLTAQALAFGVTLALLLVPANSLFLDAYGSQWLPVTYIATAVLGSTAAAFIARAARRTRLIRVAAVSLGALAAVFAASWAILVAGGDWVSGVLLVMFPIAIQIGFVFIGGQAGRLLDVRQMKELFPRVVSGFAVGFLVGGVIEIPLLALLGSTENLFLATTAAQLTFLGLLLVTERRFPEVTVAQATGAPAAPRPPLRTLFSGLLALLLAYQLLSAMGSQVVDFLLFDRAGARYAGEDLTRFLSTYTALLNLVDVVFLAVLAGPLMRRFGLRLGLTLNPATVAGVLGVMALVAVGSGIASFGVFALAGIVRIVDLTTTDGTTRTSINAAYQVVQPEERLAVQAVVEGVGVPIAIGATGVLLLVLDALNLGVGAVIAFGLLLSVLWTAVAVGVYGSYGHALGDAMRRPRLMPSDDLDDAPAVHALLRSDDARDVRLGLDLLAGFASPASEAELRRVAEGADAEVRVRALVQLAALGDGRAAGVARSLARDLAASSVAVDRRAAAAILAERGFAADRAPLVRLLGDPDQSVRLAALDAVAASDAAEPETVRRVVEAAGAARTAGRAAAAIARLGGAAVPPLAAALANADARRRLSLVRAGATAAADYGIEVVAPALGDPDRSVVLAALDALDAAGVHGRVAPDVLDHVFADAAALASHAFWARSTLGKQDGPLIRALDDEIDLARRLIIAVLALRHGDRVRAAVRVVDHGAGSRRALAVEALDVLLSRAEAAVAVPLVCHRAAADEHAPVLRRGGPSGRSRQAWIEDVADDPAGVWRSSWLAACALAAPAR
jgi:hypothetical protein